MDTHRPKQLQILVIGDKCTDIYLFGTCDRISPEAPVPIIDIKSEIKKPGMAFNVAKNVESLGADVCVFSNKEYIEKKRVIEDRFNHQLLRMDIEPSVIPATFLDTKSPNNYSGPDIHQFDGFIISDYNKGFITYSNIPEILTFLKLTKKPIFVDSKKEDLSLFEGCIIKINEKEHKNIKKLPEEHELVVTLGKKGARWRDELFPPVPTSVFDVCGAGDTFIAAMAIKYLSCSDMRESIRFANKCASIAVKHVGAYSVSEKDLNE